MRSSMLLASLVAAVAIASAGCGSDSKSPGPDAPTGNHPPPRVIAGGGIGDGPIDGVVNLYVIDDATRQPVTSATVRVGSVDGLTDATGLFVASGVTGPQTIAVAASGYRSELWLGANGANITVDLKAAVDPLPTAAELSGTIVGFDAITVPAGHHKTAFVGYSQDDHASDAENNLKTANNANLCDTAIASAPCSFTITTRTGHVALIAAILDHDLNGTPTNPADDKFTLLGWATRTGIVVQDGVAQSGQDLAMVPAGQLGGLTIDFGTPPSALPQVAAIAGIELGDDGTLELAPVTPSAPNIAIAPTLAAFPGATYRLTGIATTTSGAAGQPAPQSVVLARGQTTSSLAAPAWLSPPAGVSVTRTGGSWTATPGALAEGVEYDTDATHHLLSVTALDGSTSFQIPDILALPVSGALQVKATALAGTLDPTSFSLDADSAKITAASSQPATVN